MDWYDVSAAKTLTATMTDLVPGELCTPTDRGYGVRDDSGKSEREKANLERE